MHQVATPIWNEIAKTQVLRTPWAKTVFSMTEEEMAEHLEQWAAALETEHSNKVALAYQLTAPLLMENEAISRFISRTGRSSLRAGLPEILTPAEGVDLGSREYRLNRAEAQALNLLLQELESDLVKAGL
jgi:hypothetical protein